MAKKPDHSNLICTNKKAKFDYFIKENIEAGIVLHGWEVKSIRAKKVGLVDSYILIKKSEAFIIGSSIIPLDNVASHQKPDSRRTRKLLLHKKQINQLKGHAEVKGQALIASKLYWKDNRVKVDIAVAVGKKQYDKRETIKQREWDRQRGRITKLTQR